MLDTASTAGVLTPVSRSLVPALDRPGTRFLPFEPPLTVPAELVWRTRPQPATTAVIQAAVTLTAQDDVSGPPQERRGGGG